MVAEKYECDADDLECVEDDNGREFVSLRGEPIVEIHHQRLTGNVSGLAETVVSLNERSVAHDQHQQLSGVIFYVPIRNGYRASRGIASSTVGGGRCRKRRCVLFLESARMG